jgi:hypothetical protein
MTAPSQLIPLVKDCLMIGLFLFAASELTLRVSLFVFGHSG